MVKFSNPFTSIFDPTGKVAPTYEELQQRKKIAVAMMARRDKLPKSFGEGLGALGEAWFERSYYDDVNEQAREAARQSGQITVPPSPEVPYEDTTVAPVRTPARQRVSAVDPDIIVPPDEQEPTIVPAQAQATIQQGNLPPQPAPYTQAAVESILGPMGPGSMGNPQGPAPPSGGFQMGLPQGPFPGTNAAQASINPQAVQLGTDVEPPPGMNPDQTRAPWLLGQADAVDQMGGVPPPSAPPGPRSEAPPPSPTGAANIPPDPLGLGAAPASSPNVQTAALTPGNVMSDAPDPAGASVRDSIAATLTPGAQPPPPGPQLAQASPFPQPGSGGLATLPGGFQPPPAPAPVVRSAPPPPQEQIRRTPEVQPVTEPVLPRLRPMNDEYTRQLDAIVGSPYLDPTKRKQAADTQEAYRKEIEKVNAHRMSIYNEKYKRYLDQQTPATAYANEKARRELEGEGATPLTAEQRKAYGIGDDQAAYITRRGEIKFGPAGTKVTIGGDKAQGKGDERLQEKLSESFIKTFEEGNTAGDDIKQLAEMRALAARVKTGAGAVVKQYLGQWGIKSEGLSEIEALNAGISRLIPQQRVPGSGTSSDFDGNLFKNAVVGLSKTEAGNNLIFDTMDGLAQNKLARADVAGRVISGEITRADGVKEMLGLQRQARDLSDRVKAHLEVTGQSKTVEPAIPPKVIDDQARRWLQDNPNDPRAPEVRKRLGM